MEKTPKVPKTPKAMNTPKSASKRKNATPKVDNEDVIDSARRSVRRAPKFDIDSDASPKVAPFYTPGRTTRSMLKITSNDVLSYATPLKSSKRKTIASVKPFIVHTDVVQEDADDSNGKFVRPLPPKSKRTDKGPADTTVVDEILAISETADMSSNATMKKGRKRARKTAKMNGVSSELDAMEKQTSRKAKQANEIAAESSEEDLPSVSILGSTETPTGQFVRSRKSLARQSAVGTNDADASVSQLNTSGQFVRSRKSKHDFSDNVASSDDDLPSVSYLGTMPVGIAIPRRKSKLSIEPTPSKTVSEAIDHLATKPTRTSLSARSRKSNQAVESEANDLTATDMPEQHRISGQFVRSRKSKRVTIDTEIPMDTEELNTDETKEEFANGQIEIDSDNVGSTNEMAADEDIQQDDNNIPSIVITATKSDASVESDATVEDLSKIKNEKALKINRISVIDLTDSPLVQNKSVLNETFSPEKVEKEVNDEEAEAKDRTFTEENNTTVVNDKTFSPVPSSSEMAELSPIPTKGRTSLNVVAKSTGKIKTPQLKRLQSTPFLKPQTRNKLGTQGKLSSAKKEKLIEAAVEFVEPLKRKSMDRVKVPKPPVQSPKVFKFGDENNPADFRFSLCAPYLRANQETGKSAAKQAPNFSNMHNRMFNKAESITETRNRHDERAKLLLSGKKPTQAQAKVVKPIAKNPPPKFELNLNSSSAQKRRPLAADHRRPLAADNRRPLAADKIVNKARLNEEERQERRKQLFKQGSKRNVVKNNPVPAIKGVRMNRRFELMMKNRDAAKSN